MNAEHNSLKVLTVAYSGGSYNACRDGSTAWSLEKCLRRSLDQLHGNFLPLSVRLSATSDAVLGCTIVYRIGSEVGVKKTADYQVIVCDGDESFNRELAILDPSRGQILIDSVVAGEYGNGAPCVFHVAIGCTANDGATD